MSAITGGNVKISQLTGLDTISDGAKLRIPASIDNSATSTPNWVSYSVDGEVLSYFIKNNIGINNLESELERQYVQISDLRHDVSSNYTKITNLKSYLSTLRGDVNTNSGKISTLETNFGTQSDQINNLKTYVGDLKTYVGEESKKISSLQSDLQVQGSDMSRLATDLQTYSGRISTLQSYVDAHSGYLSSYYKIITENSKRITYLEDNFPAQGGGSGGSDNFVTSADLTNVDNRLTGQINSVNSNLTGEINSVKGDLQSYIQTYSDKIKKNSDDITDLGNSLSTLQSNVADNSKRITYLEDNFPAQGGGSGGSDVTTEQLNELKTEINSVKKDIQTYSGQIQNNSNNITNLLTDVDNNSGRITDLGNNLSTLESRFNSYSSQIDGLNTTIEAQGNSISELGTYVSSLQSDVAAHSTKIANLEQAQSGNNNALLRYEVGYFSGVEIIPGSTIIQPKPETPTSNSGKVVFCNRLYDSVEGIYAGFVYKLGEDYYFNVPDNFPYAMPSRNGIAIKLRDYSGAYYTGIDDDCAYVINGKELKKFIPKATDSSAGLFSPQDTNKLNNYAYTFGENPTATPSSAGLMSVEDKNKLDACVTTEATTSAAGLMSSSHVITLDNTLSRMEVGYFSDTVILSENERISPSILMPQGIFGEIVFCNRIFSSGSLYAGFVYRLGNSYYKTVPKGFRYRMPSRTGIAIYLNDGCAYVINGNELKKFIPVGTTGVPGLMPTSVWTRLDDIETRLAKLEGGPTLTSEGEVGA